MTVNNPFFHRGAIRQEQEFHGRKSETHEILGLLRNGQSVSVIGPRRIGKSSLLLHLCRPSVRQLFALDTPKALFVLIDCQELGGSPAEEVYETLYTGLLDAAELGEIPINKPATQADPYRALDRVLYQLSQNGTAVVVLLDEFELLAANELLTPYFFARLRGLTTKYGLAYITASQRPLYAITADEKVLSSPFFNIFVTLSLGFFTEEDGSSLFEKRLSNTPIQFSAELRAHIIELVGNHPFFLHVASYHFFQTMSHGATYKDSADYATVDALIEVEATSHLNYLWDNLTKDEQYGLATGEASLDTMRMLEQQCLLVKDSETQQYRYTSRLLRDFVRRQKVEGLIQAGPFLIDPQRHQVKADGQLLNLTNSQFTLLRQLAERFGQVLRGDDLEIAVWEEVLVDDPDRLKTLIKRLRRAVEPFNEWIVSERGVGYALRPPDGGSSSDL